MLKRGGKSSYNPYSTAQRVKKAEWKDILPNRHSVWLKQVCQRVWILFKACSATEMSVSGNCSPF